MLIADLDIISKVLKLGNNPNVFCRLMDKEIVVHIYIMDHYSAIKKKDICNNIYE